MSSVDFLIKIRDGARMIADAANERLEKIKPPEVRDNEDFDKLCARARTDESRGYRSYLPKLN